MFGMFISSALLIIGIMLAAIGMFGIGLFFIFVFSWIFEGDPEFEVNDKKINPWVVTIFGFVIVLKIASLGFTFIRMA